MLPCNVIIQQLTDNSIEIAAVDPVASMQSVKNKELEGIANEIKAKLAKFIEKV